ncbi:MAG: DUF2459 domain-containing protein [Parvibaculum sp.]|uniref:DUF2459 domain-containing protein n=1 Tax=Parvibaculum sp. TaxID=2024848 RepID=UPI002718049A|nr:DUF2459 domain-containing protein [Parvibaculum sp.]MDO8840126.1 DUF2459 domain-containing protein [Parvibaculum sp.]
MILVSTLWPAGGVSADAHRVFISSNGWHTGIVVAIADIPEERIPEAADFAGAVYLEFGWGNAEFYPTPDPGIGATLRAALPGPAVVHVAPLDAPPGEAFIDVEEIALLLSAGEFRRLIDYLHESFEREGERRVWPSARGLYRFSMFYPATGRFHLFNTCNTWTARGLAAAGLDIRTAGTQRAEDLMRQLRDLRTE